MSEFVIVPKSQLVLWEQFLSAELDRDEGEFIVEHEALILKVVEKAIVKEQIKLSLGLYRGEEERFYHGKEAMQWIKDVINETREAFKEYNRKMEELKEQAKESE